MASVAVAIAFVILTAATLPPPSSAPAPGSSPGGAAPSAEASGASSVAPGSEAGPSAPPPVSSPPRQATDLEHPKGGPLRPTRNVAQPTVSEVDRPAGGLHFGLGAVAGGDDLLTVMFTNGDSESLSAGQGLYASLGGTATPIWIRDTLGLGIGADFGVKLGAVSAKNGSAHFVRYPLTVWLQGLTPLSERWYGIIAGGVVSEFAPSLSGEGFATGLDLPFGSHLGQVGKLGAYLTDSRHAAMEFTLRYTRIEYSFGDATIDGSSFGLEMLFHYRP